MNRKMQLPLSVATILGLATSPSTFAQSPKTKAVEPSQSPGDLKKTKKNEPSRSRENSAKPDLIVSSLSARLVAPDRVEYEYTITNIGAADANLDGPTDAQNVSVQAFTSKDTTWKGLPAGGTILGRSPLGMLAPGKSFKGKFAATIPGSIREYPYLVLKVDHGNVVDESNENNNIAAVGIGLPDAEDLSKKDSPSSRNSK